MNNLKESQKKNKLGLTNICVSEKNYFELKRLGGAGDSFNDVVTMLLKYARGASHQVTPHDSLPKDETSGDLLT